MNQIKEEKISISAKLNKNGVTISNSDGKKWEFENFDHVRNAMAIMVSETLWYQFDNLSNISENFELTLSIDFK